MGVQKDGGKRIYTFGFGWTKMDFAFLERKLPASVNRCTYVQYTH